MEGIIPSVSNAEKNPGSSGSAKTQAASEKENESVSDETCSNTTTAVGTLKRSLDTSAVLSWSVEDVCQFLCDNESGQFIGRFREQVSVNHRLLLCRWSICDASTRRDSRTILSSQQ